MKTNSVLLFFIDGLGIGERSASNPFCLADNIEPLAYFKNESANVIEEGVLISTDTRLGIEGRPQSASGQTTILTGINAPKTLGYHKQGFPNRVLSEILRKHSIFLRLRQMKIENIVFANAYTPQFFESEPRWKSATTLAVEAAGIRFRNLDDLRSGNALYHDFSNQTLKEKGFNVPSFSSSEAAEILAHLTRTHRFVFYEHFITDKIGHAQDVNKAIEHLPSLAAVLRELLKKVDLERTTLILTSDHGNIEDLSTRNHTLNDVPTVVWGRKRYEIARKIRSLTDIAPAIIEILVNDC